MKRTILYLLILSCVTDAAGQTPRNLREWIDAKITSGIEDRKVAENGLSFVKQKE